MQRSGIDRNVNGVLDADEPQPQLQLGLAGANTVLSWPASAVGFILEESSTLSPGSWSNSPAAVEIVNGINYATNAPGAGLKFYRLRMQ